MLERYARTDSEWFDLVTRGLDLHVKNAREYRQLRRALGSVTSPEGNAANYRARGRYRRVVVSRLTKLVDESQQIPSRQRSEFAFVTIDDARWWTSDVEFRFHRQSATALIRNFLAGTNFLGWWEFGAIRNHRGPPPSFRGKLVTPHFHALVWGRNLRTIRKLLSRRKGRFASGFDGIKAVDIRKLPTPNDLLEVACYILKSPIMAYRLIKRRDETFRLRKSRNSYKGHLRVFLILMGYRLVDLMVAGGEGTKLAKDIRQATNGHRCRR